MGRDPILEKKTFHKIASGGFLFFLGTLSATGLQFVAGIVVIRAMAPSEFGLIILANTLVTVFVILSTIGLGTGLPKLIPKYRSHLDPALSNQLTATAITLVVISSIALTLLLYFTSSPINSLFSKPGLGTALRCFSLMIFPMALISIFTAVFRGNELTLPKVIFQDVGLNGLRLIVFSIILLMGLNHFAVIWGYVATAWVVFFAYLIYVVKQKRLLRAFPLNRPMTAELLKTSLPLMGAVLIDNLMGWAGILSLGWFSSYGEVGRYVAPHRLAATLNIPLMALAFIYLPVATQVFLSSALKGLRDLYAVSCKWLFVLSCPFLCIFLLDAEFIMVLLFGAEYRDAAMVLRLLSAGYISVIATGPNNMTLVSLGKYNVVLVSNILACLTAMVLFFFLIPGYGAVGAAAGIAAARFVSSVFSSAILFRRTGIHPFTGAYARILGVFLPGCGIFFLFFQYFATGQAVLHISGFLFIVPAMFIAIFLNRGITKPDITFIRDVEKRISGSSRLSDWLLSFM